VARLVSIVGASPGTLHTVLCLLEEQGVAPSELAVISTSPSWAHEALEIARSCPCPATGRPPRAAAARTTVDILPFHDLEGPEHLAQLRRKLAGHLDPGTLLDVTGGRKLMAVAAALEALRAGAAVVAAMVPPEEYSRILAERSPCRKTSARAKLIKL
jgi:hypothetical protein